MALCGSANLSTTMKGTYMRDRSRIDQILEAIRDQWVKDPELRLMQLLTKILGVGEHLHLEDGEVLRRLLRSPQERP